MPAPSLSARSKGLWTAAMRVAVLLWALMSATSSTAQVLAGPWVDQAEAAIDEHRKTAVRVIVLDADGVPLPNAVVRLEQLRHDFPIGFVMPAGGWPKAYRGGAEVWRCFNTVSLERHTRWADLEDRNGALDAGAVLEVIGPAEAAGLALWWGPVISADAARNPARLHRVSQRDLDAALTVQIDRVLGVHGRRAAAFDLYANTIDHDLIERRLGHAMLRRLYDRAGVLAPQASLRVRMTDVMDRRRTAEAVRTVTRMNEAFIPFDAIALEQHYSGRVEHGAVQLGLTRLEALGVPLIFASLEVTGEQPLETAVSLETVLRLVFASPSVTGICLAGIVPEDAADAEAALLDAQGRPTPAGAVFDSLFAKQWRTDKQRKTDGLGNVYDRVFAGVYQISATMPDGTVAASVVRLPKSDTTTLVMVQPNKPEAQEPAP